FVGGAWVLLRRSVRPLLLAVTLLAIVTAPSFLGQLQTNFADVPLAIVTALGVAALASWLESDAPGMLAVAALFLGDGALTKSEGQLFALAALVAAAVVARRAQRRPLGFAAVAVVAIYLPWGIWVRAHHVTNRDYAFSDLNPSYLSDHAWRVWPAAKE